MKTCSVVIAAWQAQRWIADCIESVNKQIVLSGWQYKLTVGVDGCEETSTTLRALGVGHYFAEWNVGTYVMRNSLMRVHPADAYAIFDADDMMIEEYLFTLLQEVANGIAGAARLTIDEQGKRIGAKTRYRNGVCVISKEALSLLGGYRKERLASDSDLIERARLLGIRLAKVSQILYWRRRHRESLTQREDTGMKSLQRKELVRLFKQDRAAGFLWVKPVTTSLEWRS